MRYKIVNKSTSLVIKKDCDLKEAHTFVKNSRNLRTDLRIMPENYKKIKTSDNKWVWGEPPTEKESE